MEIEFENIMDHIVESIRAAGYEPYDQLYPHLGCTKASRYTDIRQAAAVW